MKTSAAFLLLIALAGCGGTNGPTSPPTEPVLAASTLSASSVVASLRAAGLAVQDLGPLPDSFFSVPGQVYGVDGGEMQVFEFASEADAIGAAAQVSSSGGSIGTRSFHWIAPPHFFRKDRVLVNYLGSSAKTIGELQRLLGPQFAGR